MCRSNRVRSGSRFVVDSGCRFPRLAVAAPTADDHARCRAPCSGARRKGAESRGTDEAGAGARRARRSRARVKTWGCRFGCHGVCCAFCLSPCAVPRDPARCRDGRGLALKCYQPGRCADRDRTTTGRPLSRPRVAAGISAAYRRAPPCLSGSRSPGASPKRFRASSSAAGSR